MRQYCRYCSSLVTGNGIYCEARHKEISESYAKSVNTCKLFEYNPMDAFFENERGYKPRSNRRSDDAQLKMFEEDTK